MLEIGNSPRDLQLTIALGEQRDQRMAVGLRDRVALSAARLGRKLVAAEHRAVGRLAVSPEPSGERRSEIEVEGLIVVADVDHRAFHRVSVGIGGVAFTQDSFVPVLEWGGAMLGRDDSGPRALAGRLIKVAVDYDVSRFCHQTLNSARGRTAQRLLPGYSTGVANGARSGAGSAE